MQTFLIVDDKPDNLYLLQSLLNINGYNSITAVNGKEALNLARKNPPDIIISDILMPVMDGYAFCRECKKDDSLKNIPFIFYTATYTDAKDKEFALSLGASRFILKPQEPNDFMAVINDVIGEVSKGSFTVAPAGEVSETTVLKNYNEVLIRKLEDKMLDTERAKKLLESQYTLLSALINSANDILVFSLDNKYCYTAFNEPHRAEMKKVLNADIEIGMNILDYITILELRETAKKSIDRALCGESFIEIQHQPEPDIYYELNWNPIYQNKIIIGITVFAKDISSRIHSEDLLKQSEEKYRYMFLNNPQPMWIYDLESLYFLEVNNAALNHYGYSKEEFLSMTLKDIRPEEDIPLLNEDVKKQQKILNQSGVWKHRKKNGKIIYVEITSHQVTFNKRLARHVLVKDITKRILTEEKLSASEEKYRTIFENVQDVFYQTDLNGIIKDISPSVKHFSDYSREQLINSPVTKYYADESDRNKFLKSITATGEISDHELKFISKSGKIIYGSINARLIYDSNGNPNHIDGAIRDITKRKLAEEKLRISEERMRMIVEGTPNLFFYIQDTNGKVTYISPSAENITGYLIDEWHNQTDWFVTANKINHKAKERSAGHLRGEYTIGSILVEIEHKEKRPILLEVYENPIIINGVVHGIQGVAHDITERKRFENELRKLSRAIEQSPASVVIANLTGEIEYVNEKLCNITGFTREEVQGKNPNIFNSGYHPKIFFEELWNVILSGKEWKGEILNKKKNGNLFWESLLISPLLNSDGEITHFIAVKEDITEKKKILSELIEAKEKAEEMNRLKSNLMANMSHELRTPLIGILGISEFMIEDLKGEVRESAEIIHKSGMRLFKTISEILDFSKVDSENVTVNFSIFNLLQLIKDEIALYQKSAANKNVLLINNLNFDDLQICSDERMIREIVENIINNAIKFTHSGNVTVSLEKKENEVIIKISDTGIGIPHDKLDYIFEEFRQISEGKSRNFEGTGLGLTIVKKYVLLLNGTITVESELGSGSSFIVRLPYSNSPIPTNSIAAEKTKKEFAPSNVEENRFTILLVEDEPINLQVIESMLKRVYKVISVSSGQKAIDEVNKLSFDVILMDINLKTGMDGVEAAKIIRKIKGYDHKPIVAMTAYASDEERDEFLSSNFSHYIAKPFSKVEILKLLGEIINE